MSSINFFHSNAIKPKQAIFMADESASKTCMWHLVSNGENEDWHVAKVHTLISQNERPLSGDNVCGYSYDFQEFKIGYSYVSPDDYKCAKMLLDNIWDKNIYVQTLNILFEQAKEIGAPVDKLVEISSQSIDIMEMNDNAYCMFAHSKMKELIDTLYPVMTKEQAEMAASPMLAFLNKKDMLQSENSFVDNAEALMNHFSQGYKGLHRCAEANTMHMTLNAKILEVLAI